VTRDDRLGGEISRVTPGKKKGTKPRLTNRVSEGGETEKTEKPPPHERTVHLSLHNEGKGKGERQGRQGLSGNFVKYNAAYKLMEGGGAKRAVT